MKIAVMQPTFLPWIGYLKMISAVDCFIFLDDVQLSPKSFQLRNRVPASGGKFDWLTLHEDLSKPMQSRFMNDTRLQDPRLDFTNISRKLTFKYGNDSEVLRFLEKFESVISGLPNIAQLNIEMILYMCTRLNVKCQFLRSSQIETLGKGSEKVISLLLSQSCSQYFCAPGSLKYMERESIWTSMNFSISIFQYQQSEYHQRDQTFFVPQMSSVDMLFELGMDRASKFIQDSGYSLIKWR